AGGDVVQPGGCEAALGEDRKGGLDDLAWAVGLAAAELGCARFHLASLQLTGESVSSGATICKTMFARADARRRRLVAGGAAPAPIFRQEACPYGFSLMDQA